MTSLRSAAERLLEVTPQSGLAPTAVRAGLSIGLPLAVLAGLGRIDLAIYATFGSFTAVYGRRFHGPADVRVQARHAVYLVAAVASGALVSSSPDRTWWAIPVTALWAALAARASDRQGWRPPGPLFCVFAVGACSAVALSSAASVGIAVVVAAATACLALGLSAAGHLLAGPIGHVMGLQSAQAAPRAAPGAAGPPHPRHRQHVQAVRCAVAVAVAGLLGGLVGEHPYWAMVAAVAPMAAPDLTAQLVRAAHRGLGTLFGLAVAAAVLALPLNTFGVIAVAVLLQVVAELLVSRHYGAAMLAITPLALLLGQLAHPVAETDLLVARGVETCLGVVIGSLAVVLTRDRSAAAGT